MKKQSREEECCGDCCWFYGEMTCGDGFCAKAKGNVWLDFVKCNDKCKFARGGCDNPCFVSKEQMRHHMAVLLRHERWMDDDMFIHYAPDGDEVSEAIGFAVQYMKIFGRL